MTREDRAIAVNKGTKIIVPLGVLLAILGCSWWLRGAIDDYKSDQIKNFSEIKTHIDQVYWSGHNELLDFSYRLDTDNRAVSRGDGKQGLIVPPIIVALPQSKQAVY